MNDKDFDHNHFDRALSMQTERWYPDASRNFWTGKFYIAVDVFFVISGIVIANGYLGRTETWLDYADFIQRRFARLYPLHLATAFGQHLNGSRVGILVSAFIQLCELFNMRQSLDERRWFFSRG